MPPTNPTRASTSAILRCRRRRRLRRKENKPRSGRKRCTTTPATRSPSTNSGAQLARAEAVDHEPHAHAAPRRALERLAHGPPGRVVGEDVGLEPDVVGGRVDRRHERREELRAVAQERHAIAGDRLHDGSRRARQREQPRGERRVVRQARPGALPRAAASRPPSGRARRCGPARATAAAPGSSSRAGPAGCSKTSARPSSRPSSARRRPAPVVEVAGHDQGRALRHRFADALAEPLELEAPAPRPEARGGR